MAKRIVLATAGAGKTYFICHNLNPNKRNLILAFTHENIHNIKRELYDAYGCIPKLTTVMTFDSFVYNQFILPYEYTIAEYFNEPDFISNGISMANPPKKSIKTAGSSYIRNPHYCNKTSINHYITKNKQYYCETLSELVLQVKKGRNSLISRAVNRLNMFFDTILVDEFQDFRKYDYDLLMALSETFSDILLVGDYYQHSVSAKNNSGKPFDKYNTYDSFVQHLQSNNFEVDQNLLQQSRRCSNDICTYISKKLKINIGSCGLNKGSVIWADDFAKEIIDNSNITKLVYSNANKYTFNAMNWSYSKGDTLDEACVILTNDFDNLDAHSFSAEKIHTSTLNKLYVAMTRSRGNLYLIKSSTFKKLNCYAG